MKFEELYENILSSFSLLEEADVNKLIPIAREAKKTRQLHTSAAEKNQTEEAQKHKETLQNLRKNLLEILSSDFGLTSKRKEPLTELELDERIDLARRNPLLDGLEHLHSRIIKTLK